MTYWFVAYEMSNKDLHAFDNTVVEINGGSLPIKIITDYLEEKFYKRYGYRVRAIIINFIQVQKEQFMEFHSQNNKTH